jgi:peroxiredoxin Q/BCP
MAAPLKTKIHKPSQLIESMNASRKALLASVVSLSVSLLLSHAASPPAVGDTAPDFTLKTLDNKPIHLKQLTAESPTVLVVLRGWPGYQCPLCTRQVNDFVSHASELDAAGARVLMVYPGPAAELNAHAQEFLQNKNWPKSFLFVVDPDYTFTKTYGLRWDAKSETAYPSTFIVDKEKKVRFAHISKQHGDRVGALATLKALGQVK